jgi:4-hydroxy-tetrahydrodipicolinate reductase
VKTNCLSSGNTFFYASNYSVGVNIFFQMNRYLAHIMNKYEAYEPSLEEIHHIHKKDSPSGTAITLVQDMLAELSRKKNWMEGISSEKSLIQIHSRREGEVPGTHTIRYESDVDSIEITHTAHNRKGFAMGAVLAAEWIQGKKGVFGMNDMMGFSV